MCFVYCWSLKGYEYFQLYHWLIKGRLLVKLTPAVCWSRYTGSYVLIRLRLLDQGLYDKGVKMQLLHKYKYLR